MYCFFFWKMFFSGKYFWDFKIEFTVKPVIETNTGIPVNEIYRESDIHNLYQFCVTYSQIVKSGTFIFVISVNSNSVGYQIHSCRYFNKQIFQNFIYNSISSIAGIFFFTQTNSLVLLIWIIYILRTMKKHKHVNLSIKREQLPLNYIRIN